MQGLQKGNGQRNRLPCVQDEQYDNELSGRDCNIRRRISCCQETGHHGAGYLRDKSLTLLIFIISFNLPLYLKRLLFIVIRGRNETKAHRIR